MKVGTITAIQLKEKSKELQIPFADLLYAFVLEDLLFRISKSSFKEYLWQVESDSSNMDGLEKIKESRLNFYYVESEKKIAPEKLIPGQKLSEALCYAMVKEVLLYDTEVLWTYELRENKQYTDIVLVAVYCEMQIPFIWRLYPIFIGNNRIKRKMISPILGGDVFEICVNEDKNQICEYLFEIIDKLELIGDMFCYDQVNELLKTQSISGRHIMEELSAKLESKPKLLHPRRVEQIKGYRDYKYMEKRWEKYKKVHAKEDSWQEVVDRLVAFFHPIWNALCSDEIFFDDWMPELGRYLG